MSQLAEVDLNLLVSKLSLDSSKPLQKNDSAPSPTKTRSASTSPQKKHFVFVQEHFPKQDADDVYFQVYEDTDDEVDSEDSFVTASSACSPSSTAGEASSSNNSSVQSSPCPNKEPVVEPLHRKNPIQTVSHKMLLQKKLAEKKSIASPTDNMMSPCSQKLRDYKAKKGTRAPNALLVKSFMKNKKAPPAGELGTGKENEKTPSAPVPTEEEPKTDADDVF